MSKLDPYELEVLEAYESGKLQTIASQAELQQMRAAARATAIKDKRVNIRLSSADLLVKTRTVFLAQVLLELAKPDAACGVNIPTQSAVIHAQAEQPDAGLRTHTAADALSNSLGLLCGDAQRMGAAIGSRWVKPLELG